MENILHFYFENIEEIKQQNDSQTINYLNNPYAERNYFAPLSIMKSCRVGDEYVVSNYMDKVCYCVHTPFSSNFYRETKMHKHDFFEFMYISRGTAHIRIENDDFSYGTGDVCLLNRNTMHMETDISDADIYYIAIEPQMLINWPNSILPPFRGKGILSAFFKANLSEKAAYKKDYVNFSALCDCSLREPVEEIITAFRRSELVITLTSIPLSPGFLQCLKLRKTIRQPM